MNTLPKVTIITVVYNSVELIERTIQSVLAQDYPSIEYIIIDGNSNDGTVDIIKNYKKGINYWVSEFDEGIYDAMNKGIDIATGLWVNYMNAGDIFADVNVISKIIADVEKETDLICGDTIFIESDSGEERYIRAPGIESIWKHTIGVHQSMFIRTSLMKKYKYNLRYKFSSDYDLFIKLHINRHNFQFVTYAVSCYLYGGSSVTINNRFYSRLEAVAVLANYIPDITAIADNFLFQDMVEAYNEEKNYDNFEFSKHFNIIFHQLNEIKQQYKKIAIYGNGTIGEVCASYLIDHVVVVADKQEKLSKYPTCIPENLKKYNFDCIIISVMGHGRENSIYKYLIDKIKISVDDTPVFCLGKNEQYYKIPDPNSKNSVYQKAGICTQETLDSPVYRKWENEFKLGTIDPISKITNKMHRKLWEWCFIAQALFEQKVLLKGKRGLGFAVGTEPLSSMFCHYGASIVATDLSIDVAQEKGWVDTRQHAFDLSALNARKLCETEKFKKLCQFKNVDMNAIPDSFKNFDFLWSSCSLEHLGSLELGEQFIYNAMKCLKPGGVAVHTTEYNFSSDINTIRTGPTVLYRKKDIKKIRDNLVAKGHTVLDINFDSGTMPDDLIIDVPPYYQDADKAHLKLKHEGYVITSIGIIIIKKQ
ncbi:MAG: glycosyltransferase [Pseudomonadota bacterium]